MQTRTYRALLTFMGACTPGGFLFLFALLTNSNVHFDEPLWYLLAAGGGVGGYMLAKKR